MNAPQFPALEIAEALPADSSVPLLTAKMAAHAWRGQCLAEFARAEGAVTRTLFSLAPADKRLNECHLVGARFEALDQLLQAKGGACKNAAKAIATYRPWHQLRTFLCHGEINVAGSTAETWQATFRLVGFASERLKQEVLLLSATQAEAERRALHSDTDSLVSLLKPHSGAETVFDRLSMSGALIR